MRKILVHAGLSPLDRPDMDTVFRERLFTTNSGNLLFQYTAYRSLMTEDTQFISRFLDRGDLDDAFVERVNGECECVILPMANNFRPGYDLIRHLTAFVRRLKIPCVVMGVGLQADSADDIRGGFPFDEDVKSFVDAVLDHSAQLGLRGELTAEYLTKLGYSPERHFTVTGCPSMYARGIALPEPRLMPLTAEDPVSINYRKEQPGGLFAFMDRALSRYGRYTLLFQRVEEMFALRYGLPVMYEYRQHQDDDKPFPTSRSDPRVRKGHAAGFANAEAWFDCMARQRLSVGCRIHGNIAAVLSGTPALVFTIDTRTEELCRYHRIPFIPASQIDPDTDLRTLYEATDFAAVTRDHSRRFAHFVDFLNANGLTHVCGEGALPGSTPFDRAVAALPRWGEITSKGALSPIRYARGAALYWPKFKKRARAKLRHILR
ncbi:MAG: polysaccharide pyruvyl transferase family protein [Clostridia bacterium]|nr:polysaccharide pyruvyl transferase family protein [Clostridia bacterium]